MPEKITWSLSVQVAGGPRIMDSKTVEVDAYDKIRGSYPGWVGRQRDPDPAWRCRPGAIPTDQL